MRRAPYANEGDINASRPFCVFDGQSKRCRGSACVWLLLHRSSLTFVRSQRNRGMVVSAFLLWVGGANVRAYLAQGIARCAAQSAV